jgi:pimeloyl-ACP methyl ester carboxylesterase
MLCLHGLLRNSRDFEDLAPHLARQYRVVVPDIRGRGLSDRDTTPANYQLPVYISDLTQLLTGLGAPRVAIIGTSMGGLIAMVMAVMHPGLISRIVLNDVGPEVDPRGLERIRGYAGRSVPVKSWPEAIAQLRGIFGAAWQGLSEERWQQLVISGGCWGCAARGCGSGDRRRHPPFRGCGSGLMATLEGPDQHAHPGSARGAL